MLVAPPIAAQLPPELSQRCQAYAKLVGELVHEPFEAVSSDPSFAEPLIEGSDVFAGTAWPTAEPTPTSMLAATASAPVSTAILLVKLMVSSLVVFSGRYSHAVQAERQLDVKT